MASKKDLKKLQKQSNKTLLIITILLLIISGTLFTLWISGISFAELKNKFLNVKEGTIEGNTLVIEGETPKTLDAYYLDIVNIGDSNLIKVGDFDILIDAGEKRDGTEAVVPFLNQYVTDKVIDLTIVTHSDSDHNGGFSGLKKDGSYTGVYYADFTFSYITDYGYKEKYEDTEYEIARNNAINKSNAKYQSIIDAFLGKDETYTKIKIGTDFTLEFIDTHYYDIYGADVNDRSITLTMTYFGKTFFFGGDINKEQESLIVDDNKIPHIDFYKASHHGSITSNSAKFLDKITPSYIFLNTEIGNKHNIPNIASLNIISNYAGGNIYLTGLNGTINVHLDEAKVTLNCANNKTKFIETEEYRKILNGELHN